MELKDLKQTLIAASTASAPEFKKNDLFKLSGNREAIFFDKAAAHRIEIDGKHHYVRDPYTGKESLRLWDQGISEFLGVFLDILICIFLAYFGFHILILMKF